MRRFIRLFMAMLLAVISTGCGKKAVVSDDTQFMEFISSYPQNKISRHAAIRIVLAHPSEKAKPGQREEENLFSLSPKVEGATYWIDNRPSNSSHPICWRGRRSTKSLSNWARWPN